MSTTKAKTFELNAEVRTDLGKGASRRLRQRTGHVPGIIYGSGKPPVSITLKSNEIAKSILSEAFYSSIITVNLSGKSEKAVVKDMQRHPAKEYVMHVDLLRVDDKKELHIYVPLHFINEDTCVAVKMGGGKITHNMSEVEIACLPSDLPEYIEVDMLEVQVDQIVHLSDIKLPKGVSIVALAHGEDHDHPIAAIHLPKAAGADAAADAAIAADAAAASAAAADKKE